MAEENLRKLIQLIPPARALKEELERVFNMEQYAGLGDMGLRNLRGLLDSVARLTDDPYVQTLAPDLPEEASDKEKVAAVLLATGQLIAYLEGQAGIAGRKEGGDNIVVNLAGARVGDVSEGFEKIAALFAKMFSETKFGEECARRLKEQFGKKEGEKGEEKPE